MTPQQRQHARDLWSYYWKRMHGVMAERRQLSLLMQVCSLLTMCSVMHTAMYCIPCSPYARCNHI